MNEAIPEHMLWVWALMLVYNDKKTSRPKMPTTTTSLFKHNSDDLDALALNICQVKMFGHEIPPEEWDALCYLYLRRLRERCLKQKSPRSL
jgi:hypothetical protein